MKLNNNDDSHNSGLNLLIYNMLLDIESHPAWVCGLKHGHGERLPFYDVTPCVGVWIETVKTEQQSSKEIVTPCVGVWIETHILTRGAYPEMVTPCVGVWIETDGEFAWTNFNCVTPCVGVWIETRWRQLTEHLKRSHPAWVCGLKHLSGFRE